MKKTNKRKICFVTGARSDYGLLHFLLKMAVKDSAFKVQILVTGSHLSKDHGLTFSEIENDGFRIDLRVDMLISDDTSAGVVKSMGVGMIGFAEAYKELTPDLLVVLGDRYEILVAVSAALIYQIPVAHISGGELTEGAVDDSIRHAITKLSNIHFTATKEYRQRVIQMGENPSRVFNIGEVGLDYITHTKLLSKREVEKQTGFTFGNKNILVTFHPETIGDKSAILQISEILKAFEKHKDMNIVFTKPNADMDGKIIWEECLKYQRRYPKRIFTFVSLGRHRYLSMMKYMDAVVGNTSSGIVEAPSLHVASINIGSRQTGRIRASSVINVPCTCIAIDKALDKIYSTSYMKVVSNVKNPYGKGNSSLNLLKVLKKTDFKTLLLKKFYDKK